jgi:hypothetical protein
MTQVEVWETTANGLTDSEDVIIFWADKLVAVCEHIHTDTRIGNIVPLFKMMEEVCDRYNKARNCVEKAKKDE